MQVEKQQLEDKVKEQAAALQSGQKSAGEELKGVRAKLQSAVAAQQELQATVQKQAEAAKGLQAAKTQLEADKQELEGKLKEQAAVLPSGQKSAGENLKGVRAELQSAVAKQQELQATVQKQAEAAKGKGMNKGIRA